MPQTIQHINSNVSFLKGLTFKNERGVPLIADKENNTLTFNAGTTAQQAIYAYEDTTVVGKLNVQAYSYKDVKVHLVRVNNAKMPDINVLRQELNDVFQQAVVRLVIDEVSEITLDLGHKFVHGGTRRLRAYNEDQRAVINEIKSLGNYNSDDYYVFFIDDVVKLDNDGKPLNDIMGGYMPVGWHFGFIYDNPTTPFVAHEIAHGTLCLHHTFSDETETFYARKNSTQNLMDYNGGTEMTHSQWKWAHGTHGREWFEEEEEGERIINKGIMLSYLRLIHDANDRGLESLFLSVADGFNFSYDGDVELGDEALTFLSMSTYHNCSINKKHAPSIRPYEKNVKEETDSLVTYVFNSAEKIIAELPLIHFTIKKTDRNVFENYLYGQNIDISKNITWISQLDENIFGKCVGCWKKSCCRRACEYMLGNTNIANCNDSIIAKDAPYKKQLGSIILASFVDNSKNYTKEEYNSESLNYYPIYDEGFNYIKSELQARRPVIIGVHYVSEKNAPPNNKNRATRHWMVVVGIGIENGVRFLRFYDAGRKKVADGTSPDNRLIFDSNTKCFKCNYNSKTYTLTEIIKY